MNGGPAWTVDYALTLCGLIREECLPGRGAGKVGLGAPVNREIHPQEGARSHGLGGL